MERFMLVIDKGNETAAMFFSDYWNARRFAIQHSFDDDNGWYIEMYERINFEYRRISY